MSLAAIFAIMLLQTSQPAPSDALERATPYLHEAGGFLLTLPEGWRYLPLEDGSGLVLTHDTLDARIEAFAVPAEPSGVPGLPDDTIDALILRLEGPGFRPGARVRVPLIVAGDTPGDRTQAGEADALSYTGASADRRWRGLAATRCSADLVLALDAGAAAFDQARAVFDGVGQSWALVLTGGADFPCGGR